MDKTRLWIQRVAALCILLTILGTLVSFFIKSPASTPSTPDDKPDDPKVDSTDTARTPWISVDKTGLVTIYPENMLSMTELVIPSTVDGIHVTGLSSAFFAVRPRKIKSVVFPSGLTVNGEETLYFREWESLETIVFSEGVSDLEKLDILSMPSLKEIYLPKTLTVGFYIYSLRNCGDGVTIYYAGTEEEWALLGDWAARLTRLDAQRREEEEAAKENELQNGTSQGDATQGDPSLGDTSSGDGSAEETPKPEWPKITLVFEASYVKE